MAIAPLQFTQRLRHNIPRVHRWLGYLFLLSSVVLSISGTGFTFPFTATSYGGFGWDLFAWTMGLNLPITGVKALLAAWRSDFGSHREWMIRHVFAGYSIPLLRWVLIAMAPVAQYFMVSSSFSLFSFFLFFSLFSLLLLFFFFFSSSLLFFHFSFFFGELTGFPSPQKHSPASVDEARGLATATAWFSLFVTHIASSVWIDMTRPKARAAVVQQPGVKKDGKDL